jgi:hypothetical protein
VQITDPESVAWRLFAELDDQAEEQGATLHDVLDVAAVVVATYVLRMRAELGARGMGSDAELAAGDRATWRVFRERVQRLIDGGTVH